jgi:hypothetical protein
LKTLFWGGLIFSFFFLVHLALWKIRLPRRQIKTILIILFFGSASTLTVMAFLPPDFQLLGMPRPAGIAEFVHVALLVTALILAYMITYTAIEADSPSLVMISRVKAGGARGVRKEEFDEFLNDRLLVLPRIDDLLKDKMAVLSGGRYRLTPKGRILAEIFGRYRAILGLGLGG